MLKEIVCFQSMVHLNFRSKTMHLQASPDTPEHRENMENMAEGSKEVCDPRLIWRSLTDVLPGSETYRLCLYTCR